MFKKIVIANRGDNGRVAAKPDCMVREAHAGDFEPMDRATVLALANRDLRIFRYYYQVKYGSPPIDEARLKVSEVRVAPDGLSAELIVPELKAGFVYEFELGGLRTLSGEALANPIAYYTANRLLSGEVAPGGTTRLPRPNEEALGAKQALKQQDRQASR